MHMVSLNASKLLRSYISDHWQMAKINLFFSLWSKLLQGVPHLLVQFYSISTWWFFPLNCNACIFIGDTTPYFYDLSLNFVFENSEEQPNVIMIWFENNYMRMSYFFHRQREFQIPRVNTVWKGSNSARYYEAITWDLVSSFIVLKIQAHWKISRLEFINGNLKIVPAIGFCDITD